MRVLPYGARAVLLELEGLESVSDLLASLSTGGDDGVLDLVPGGRTVLVHFDSEQRRAERWPELLALAQRGGAGPPPPGRLVTVDVVYDGEDLADVAAHAGLTVTQVVALHAGGDYRVSFCGFAPGFAYLAGLATRLHVPRLATPRPIVPAGAVAVACGCSGAPKRPCGTATAPRPRC